jgi:hypothetical protein
MATVEAGAWTGTGVGTGAAEEADALAESDAEADAEVECGSSHPVRVELPPTNRMPMSSIENTRATRPIPSFMPPYTPER